MPTTDESLAALHAAVNCYLSTLETVARTLAQACPPIGKPFGHRLSRMRARLAFDSGCDKIEESCATAAHELEDYAAHAAGYMQEERAELYRGLASLQEIARVLTQRQEFYGERLRRFANEMEKDRSAEAIELHVSGLISSLESLSHESQSLLKRTRDEMADVQRRLEAIQITDDATGLLNRREMERSIAAAQAGGETPVLLLFKFHQDLPGEAARQIGERLGLHFRHYDLIGRWSECQFLVLFQGDAVTAQMRCDQILPWLSGPYQLADGTTLEPSVEARIVDEALSAQSQSGVVIA